MEAGARSDPSRNRSQRTRHVAVRRVHGRRRPDRSSSASSRDSSTTRTSREWRQPGSGRSASSSAGGRWSRAGAPIAGADRTTSSAPRLARNPAVPVRVDVPAVGGRQPRERPPIDSAQDMQAWRDFLKAAVARYGPGGSYWTNGYRQRVRRGRHAAADPVLADLERAQPEEVLRPGGIGRAVAPGSTPGCCGSPTTRSRARIRRPGSSSPATPAIRPAAGRGPGTSSTPSTACPGSRATSTPPPCTPIRQTSRAPPAAPAVPRGDEQPRRQAHAAVDHRARLGIGASRPLRHQPGPRGSSERLLTGAFKMILNHRSAWNVQRLFWFLWRDPAPGVSVRAPLQLLRQRGACLRYGRTRKPAYTGFRGFTAETTRPQASITAGPSQGGFINDPDPQLLVCLERAGSTFECRSTRRPSGPAARRTRSGASPTALTPSSSRRSTPPETRARSVSRSFTVDTVAPAVTISSGPGAGHGLGQSEPLVQLRLQRFRRQPQLPARRRRLSAPAARRSPPPASRTARTPSR